MNKPMKMNKKGCRCWALSNRGTLLSTHRTQRLAIEAAELRTGRLWRLCSLYMEVRRVTIVEGWR